MNNFTFILFLALLGVALADMDNRCFEPVETGPCRNMKFKWGFNPNKSICEQFVYGGCQGSGNNFDTQKQCMDTCWNNQQ